MRVRRNAAWRMAADAAVRASTSISPAALAMVEKGRPRSRAEWRAATSKPRGKPPMDAFGKPCTWGGDKGWLDSKDQPHIVMRNAKRTALSADAARQRAGKRQQLAAMRLERRQQAAEKRQQDKEQKQVEDEEREWRRQLKQQQQQQKQQRRDLRLAWSRRPIRSAAELREALQCNLEAQRRVQAEAVELRAKLAAAMAEEGDAVLAEARKAAQTAANAAASLGANARAVPIQMQYMNGETLEVEGVVQC